MHTTCIIFVVVDTEHALPLARRIIEIEWAVKNGKSFQPSPKRPRKNKHRKKGKFAKDTGAQSSSDVLSKEVINCPGEKAKETFGVELTNTDAFMDVGSPPKRLAAEMLEGETLETPQKHKKGKLSVDEGSDDDWEQWEPPAPAKIKGEREVVL